MERGGDIQNAHVQRIQVPRTLFLFLIRTINTFDKREEKICLKFNATFYFNTHLKS